MNSSVKTYEDLLREEQRLLLQLKSHEELIKIDIEAIKVKLKPVGNVFNMFKKMTTREYTGPLANLGIDFSIDLLIRKILLARAGWFTKLLVPYVIKNYSSHIISKEQRSKWAKKIQHFFDNIRPKKKTSPSES